MSDAENLDSQENLVSQPDPAVSVDEPTAPEQIEINGKMYDKETVENLTTRFDKMEGAHTQRSQDLADQRREWEEQRSRELADIEAQRAALSAPKVEQDDDEVARLHNRLDHLTGLVEKNVLPDIESRQEAMRKFQAETALDETLAQFETWPIADTEGTGAMKQWLTDRKLGPEYAMDAYKAAFGERVAMAKGEATAAARMAAPVMHSTGTGVSPGFTSPGDANQTPDVANQSWEDLERLAMEDDLS